MPSFRTFLLLGIAAGLSSCDKPGGAPTPPLPAETTEAAKLKSVKDPVLEEMHAFSLKTRQSYNSSRFDELETLATHLRSTKEIFNNGSWKIHAYYSSFDCKDEEPETMWQLHEKIHKDWIRAKPDSITPRVAYANFLTGYAWHARGSGWASTITPEGGRLFAERLAAARKVLVEALPMHEKDPFFWSVALRVALGEGLSKEDYDDLVEKAVASEPQYWGYDTSRAYSLLPRWYGEEGDWEAYADKAASRPNGLGDEVYARITIYLLRFYDNIFKETKVSWPKTRHGLEILMSKHPTSIEILSRAAMLATFARDRDMAKDLFAKLGDSYVPDVWKNRRDFVRYRHWAQTGSW